MEMQENPNQLPIIEIKPKDVIVEEVKAEGKNLEETRYPMEITPEDEMSIIPDFQVHVAVKSQDEKITDTGPDHSPTELTSFKTETEGNQQIEVKTEFEWLKTNTNTEVNTEYERSTKAEIEEVIINAECNQAEADQSRPDRMSFEETELNQHQDKVSQ